MTRVAGYVLVLAFGFASVGDSVAFNSSGGIWVTLASIPSARQEISTGELNGKIYVIAGFNSARVFDQHC